PAARRGAAGRDEPGRVAPVARPPGAQPTAGLIWRGRLPAGRRCEPRPPGEGGSFLLATAGDGSTTSGVPTKSRTWGQAAGILIGGLAGRSNDPSAHPVRRAGASEILVSPMSEVTRILSAIEQGDPHAAEQLLPLVYEELRQLAAVRLAQEKPGQTLQPTALVHEAYLRLVASPGQEPGESQPHWNSRGHFFA